jgi:hypothetical protein
LLQKLVMLSGAPMPSAKLARRREKVDVICEAVRALDATDFHATIAYFPSHAEHSLQH